MKKYMFMAVAGMLALSSCSSDDNEQTPQNAPRQMTFTAGFGDGTQTRTTLNADKSVEFDSGDAISIFSENNTNVQFTTTDGGATAEFTGTAVAGDATYYAVYPYNDSYTFSGGIVSGVTIEEDQEVNSIEGYTWSKSSVISYATATGSDLEFHNACALLKITNDTGYGATIQISADQSLAGTFDLNTSTGALTVTAGSREVTTHNAIAPGNPTVYLAIAPGEYTNFTAAKSSQDGQGGAWYSKTKASVTFAAGKIYDLGTISSWMPQAPALNLTSPAVGQVIGDDGKNYDYASLPDGVTAVALICYVNGSNGLALALADEGDMDWSTAKTTCAAHTPAITGGAWLLASKDQWTSMINAAGSYTALRDGFSSVGGSNMQSGGYWSSTEHEEFSDWAYGYGFNDGEWRYLPMTDQRYVRACLAWPQAASAETTDVTWNFSELSGSANLNEGYTNPNGVTLQGMGDLNFDMGNLNAMGSGLTFTAPSGKKFTKIVINATGMANIDDWTNESGPGKCTSTWTGDASTVSFTGMANGITSIVFTLEETDDVTWKFSEMTEENPNLNEGYTYKNVTLSGNGNLDIGSGMLMAMGDCTFTAPSGKNFKKIVITATNNANISGSDWTSGGAPGNFTSTWTGNASTVSIGANSNANGVTSIVFILE